MLEALYVEACTIPSDINEHLPTLRRLAEQSHYVLELGTRYGTSTTALLAAQPEVLISLDIHPCHNQQLADVAGKTVLRFIQADSLTWIPDEYDLLFIDTEHTFAQVTAELEKYAPKIASWIVLHDTASFPEVRKAMQVFLDATPEWRLVEDHMNNNGLAVLGRVVR